MPCCTTAENDAYAAIESADQTYNNSFDSLSNLFGTALEIIDNGENVADNHFSSATNNGSGVSYATQVNNTNQQTQKKPGLLDRLKSFGNSVKQYTGNFIAELRPAYARNADNVQTTLDVGSPLPIIGIPADALNGTIHAVRGNYAGVATSGLGMVPFFGDAYQAGRLAKKGADLLGEAAKKHAIQEALVKGEVKVIKITRPQHHHLFPVAHRQWFKDRGIDIDKYTIELEQGVHEAIHRQDWEGHWNKELMKRLTKAEKDAGRQLTVREIWNIMDRLRRQYKLPNDIVPYR